MLVESIGFTFKSSISEEGESLERFDLLSAFSRPVDVQGITTLDREELRQEFSKGVILPEWLTLDKVSSPHRLSFGSLTHLVQLEYVIEDSHPLYSMIGVERFCNHLLWALSTREEALEVRYVISNSVSPFEYSKRQ